MAIYVLHDTKYNTFLSRADGFNRQWMAFIQKDICVKFAHISMKDFKDNDTIIFYLDNKNPYGNYNLNKNLRKIAIVGELTNENIDILKTVDHVIYLNPLQEHVAHKYGINKNKTICQHHPYPNLNINLNKTKDVFIGGLFSSKISYKFEEKLLKLHEKIPLDYSFNIYFSGNGVLFNNFKNTFIDWVRTSILNGSRIVKINFNKDYINTFILNIITSKIIYLFKNEISATGNHSIQEMLNNGIRDSSILSIAKRYENEIICEDALSYINYFKNTEYNLDFLKFSNIIKEIL